jgi:predicted nucleic acid-binding protein
MTTVVLDASVVVKWIFPSRPQEAHAFRALQILQEIRQARLEVVQPPHWLAEVAAVTARLEPRLAHEAVSLLYALEFPVLADVEIYQKACELATALGQHVFDTLYHAVALTQPGAKLVTADERYYRKAARNGRIVRLQDFHPKKTTS